ncbi:MAG: hypothetical protein AB3A66_30375 (plasmid) [Nodularia sp. CChRGM 3473]
MNKKRTQKIFLEGNNGGDYLNIQQKKGELVLLEIGHACVPSIAQVLPLPVITAALTKWILSHNNDIEQAIKSQGWSSEYTNKLIETVRQANGEKC